MYSETINSDFLIVKTTESNFKNANNLAKNILAKKLAACVSFLNINSIYFWEDRLEESSEVQLVIKTRKDLLDEMFKVIKDLHSYKVPEFIFINASASNEYSKWIKEVTKL